MLFPSLLLRFKIVRYTFNFYVMALLRRNSIGHFTVLVHDILFVSLSKYIIDFKTLLFVFVSR